MMKKITCYFICISAILLLSDCDPYLDFDPQNFGTSGTNTSNTGVLNQIEVEVSENDPQQTGVSCGEAKNFFVDILDVIDIPDSLPEQYDLSEFMPPVRSQGNQGSCVSWATAYYLKSYQEKVQYGYEYESFQDVMSPAFVYNQTANGNCGAGSSISGALEILKTQGVVPWENFPYSDEVCSLQPTSSLLELAEQNQIEEYFIVGIPDSISDPNYTQINLMRTLLTEENPIVMSFSIKEINFSYQNSSNNEYIGLSFTQDPSATCGHAVLIVGYDDTLKAFKFVNSWGTFWGNEGYAWISYNFFKPEDDPSFQQGVNQTYIAYDKIEDGT